MIFDKDQIDKLEAPLDRSKVSQREAWKGGPRLDYIEGWHAIAEANRIFGFDGWERRTVDMTEVRPPELIKNHKDVELWHVGYMARVRIIVHQMIEQEAARPAMVRTVREGTGFGSGISKDLGDAIESAIKEAETDAMKRGLMTFGNPFGLALYDKAQSNVVDIHAHERDELIKLIQSCTQLVDLEALGTRCKTFAEDGAPDNYVRQVRSAYASKKGAYENARAA